MSDLSLLRGEVTDLKYVEGDREMLMDGILLRVKMISCTFVAPAACCLLAA